MCHATHLVEQSTIQRLNLLQSYRDLFSSLHAYTILCHTPLYLFFCTPLRLKISTDDSIYWYTLSHAFREISSNHVENSHLLMLKTRNGCTFFQSVSYTSTINNIGTASQVPIHLKPCTLFKPLGVSCLCCYYRKESSRRKFPSIKQFANMALKLSAVLNQWKDFDLPRVQVGFEIFQYSTSP